MSLLNRRDFVGLLNNEQLHIQSSSNIVSEASRSHSYNTQKLHSSPSVDNISLLHQMSILREMNFEQTETAQSATSQHDTLTIPEPIIGSFGAFYPKAEKSLEEKKAPGASSVNIGQAEGHEDPIKAEESAEEWQEIFVKKVPHPNGEG